VDTHADQHVGAALDQLGRLLGTRAVPSTAADNDAFLASLGNWKGIVDTEKLKKDIQESRRISGRPPIRL
jgi:hypothetical protein